MRFTAPVVAALGFITVASAAPAAVPVAEAESSPANMLAERQSVFTLTSYLTGTCGTIKGYTVAIKNVCTPLAFAAKSLKTQSVIPSACVLYGYSESGCKGYNNIFVLGPTSTSTCYKTLPNLTGDAQTTIKSVKLQC